MSEKMALTLQVNGVERTVQAWPMARLLDVIREDLQLTGTKEGCGEGECGACSVFLNGKLVNSCLVPAVQCNGATLETIEGVATEVHLHPVQDAFLRCGGAQCGICTPGMVMAAMDLLKRCPEPSEAEVRDGLSGNLCRCTGYVKIIDSVLAAAKSAAPDGAKAVAQ
jgi:carbon-monoxide dehydrogenase small subunit